MLPRVFHSCCLSMSCFVLQGLEKRAVDRDRLRECDRGAFSTTNTCHEYEFEAGPRERTEAYDAFSSALSGDFQGRGHINSPACAFNDRPVDQLAAHGDRAIAAGIGLFEGFQHLPRII